MKPKWKDEEINELLKFIEDSNKKNKPLMLAFKEYATFSGRKPLSIRNFYYNCIKMLKNNEKMQKKYNFNPNFHIVCNFKHFDKGDEIVIKNSIEKLVKKGFSVRKACIMLADNDMTKMLRLQNKYRSLTKKQKSQYMNSSIIDNYSSIKILKNNPTVLQHDKNTIQPHSNNTIVYNFPSLNTKKTEKLKLSDDDLKSLFMGLVNLVKENAKSSNQEKFEMYLQKTEEDKRRHIVELEQKQYEINRLNQSINDLKEKNMFLNKCLENYRINYLNNQIPKS